jgi:DNA-binding transcriptional LysR family regulator
MNEKKVRSADLNSARAKRSPAEAAKKIHALDFEILKTFKMAASAESFHDAAKKLGTSQPRVSQRIKQLEEFLGRDNHLFGRDGRGRRLNALTPRGQEFLVHAEKLIRMCGDMEDMFRDPSTVRGIMRVGVSESVVHTWLPALLKQVNAAYPNLEIEIEVDISPKLRNLLAAGDLNLAFLLRSADPDPRSRSLCKFPVAFVASKEIALPHKSITLEDIVNRNHRIITFAHNTQPLMVLRDLLRDRGLHATIWASASLEAVVRLALEGLGIAVIPPAILAEKAEARDRLRPLNTNIKLPPLDYVVSWSSASDKTVQKVIDIAMKVAREWPKAAGLDK